MYKIFFKPAFDFLAALAGILIFMPLLLPLVIILLLRNKGNPFFLQRRPGKNGRTFVLIKLKTMTDDRDAAGNLLPDHLRLTRLGRLIRKTSLDEVPQLVNVLKGDMSLIGPRPLLVEYLGYYNNRQARRHEVKPGITGLAQVMGRNSISWHEKFEYDVYYVENLSFRLDITIMWRTLLKVVQSEGISANGHVTMEKFQGN